MSTQPTESPEQDEEFITEQALRNASEGLYEHTFLEMWDTVLGNLITATKEPLELDVAASILQAYPWLDHSGINPYREKRVRYLEEAREVLTDVLGDQMVKLYTENENDWTLHKDIYIEILKGWKELTETWAHEWAVQAARTTPSKVDHAVIADVSGILLSPQYGLVEQLRNLKDFEFTEEDRNRLAGLTE